MVLEEKAFIAKGTVGDVALVQIKNCLIGATIKQLNLGNLNRLTRLYHKSCERENEMKILVAIPLVGSFVKQEEVEVEKMIFVSEFVLALHRPVKGSRDQHSLWFVSDMASGIRISQSISAELAIEMAIKRTHLHKAHFIEGRKKLLKTTVFLD